MKKENITQQEAKELIKGKLSRYFGVAPVAHMTGPMEWVT